VRNSGTIALPLTLAPSCGSMTSCVANPASMMLAAGSSSVVAVSFLAPTGYSVWSTVSLAATSTAGGQSITRSASAHGRTPAAEPWVNPKTAAGTSVVVEAGQPSSVAFSGGSNPANASNTYSLSMSCPASWYCSTDTSQMELPWYGTSVWTSVTPPASLGA